ncbi:MAG TPA: carbohydrate ABC transporter permease [Gaiellaceae bacterium]|nr:carbohydrate ABC transporter permease [Gaiellaceae bacterium]
MVDSRVVGLLRILKYGVLALVISTVLFPAFVALSTSLKRQGEVYSSPPKWIPSHFDFGNYVQMFKEVPLAHAFWNSFVIAGGATLLVVIAALPAGYALARYRFPGRRAVLFGILSIIMFSPIVIVISLFRLMASYHLIDKWYAVSVADATFALPFSVWIMVGYLRSVPRDVEEAALVDGCTPFRAFAEIVIPLALPGLATVVIFGFVQSWNEFLLAASLLTDPSKYPLPVAMFDFVGEHGVQWEYVTGAVLLSSLPVLVMFWLVQRWFIRGLTFGAVK